MAHRLHEATGINEDFACCELVAYLWHFDGLVDEGMLQPERGGLKRQTLTGPSRLDPVRLVIPLRDENGERRRAANMPPVLVILVCFREHERQDQLCDPGGERRIA